MHVVQIFKKLNNTELGKTGTHETYILVPNDLDVSDIFDKVDDPIMFIFKKTKKQYKIRLTIGREERIVGLGPFYRDNNINAGDEILLEKVTVDNESKYFIDVKKEENILMIKKTTFENSTPSECFEFLNEDRLDKFIHLKNAYMDGKLEKVEIRFLWEKQKRIDSPITTRYYSLLGEEESIINKLNKQQMIELRLNKNNDAFFVNEINLWKKNTIEKGK